MHSIGNIYNFKLIKSTMETANNFVKNYCKNLTIIISISQQFGHGRLNRHWNSNCGGLYFSIIVKKRLSEKKKIDYNFIVVISIIKTIKKLFNIDVFFKWPNDIMFQKCKIAGLLLENYKNFTTIGVGINVNNSFEISNAISIKKILKKNIKKTHIILFFINFFKFYKKNLKKKETKNNLEHVNITIGKFIKIITKEKIIKGIAYNTNCEGHLQILNKKGFNKAISFGDCFHN